LRKIVDHFRATVEGVPAEWVSGNESELQLNPDGHGEIVLTITPTHGPASVAREYPVAVRVQSRANPQESGVAAGTWSVTPFYGSHLALEPSRANGIGSVTMLVRLKNEGNTAVSYQLVADDSERRELTYRFEQPQVRVGPGEDAHTNLTV